MPFEKLRDVRITIEKVNKKMSMSPGDFYAEAERKMTDISTDSSGKKYDEACELFVKAGSAFAKARNFKRAGDSYRKATDCMLHSGNIDKAATHAAESGRNYAKVADCEDKSFEAFNVALRAYKDLKKSVYYDKLTVEAAKIFEQNKRYEKSVHYHNIVCQSYIEQNKTQDAIREKKTIAGIYVKAALWKEAAKCFEEIFNDYSADGNQNNALEFGVKSVLSLLAVPDTASARFSNERFASKNKIWLDSQEAKFVKGILMNIVAKHLDKVQADATDFAQKHGYEYSFGKIVTAIVNNNAETESTK